MRRSCNGELHVAALRQGERYFRRGIRTFLFAFGWPSVVEIVASGPNERSSFLSVLDSDIHPDQRHN